MSNTYNYSFEVMEDIVDYVLTQFNNGYEFGDYVSLKDLIENGSVDDLINSEDLELTVTGNDDGSYYCDSTKAKNALEGNVDLMRDAMANLDMKDRFAEWFLDGDYESIDVCVRIYVFTNACNDAWDELERIYDVRVESGKIKTDEEQ